MNQVSVEVAHSKGGRHEKLLRSRSLEFMKKLKLRNAELSVSLVTDRAIRRLNRTWRQKDKPTDVLSFPAGDAPKGVPGPKLLGDVVISLDTTSRVAKELGKTIEAELSRYLAHGLLHLLGHDHLKPAEAKRMRKLENTLLGEEGLIPEGVHGE
ncbi:MAG: rRNA maturation RNase YbeY [Myxococcaceae bacterium]